MFEEVASWAAAKALETTADKALKDRGKLASFMKSAWNRCFDGKTLVIITGLGGSGKSKIQKIISGEIEIRNIDSSYVLSTDNEKTTVKGDYFCKIYTRPGQSPLLNIMDNEIVDQISRAKKIILINVVTYGYNSLYQVPLNLVSGYDKNSSPAQISSLYLQDERDKELDYLEKFLKIFGGLKTTQQLSVVTVMNKMDLWWGNRNHVREHYQDSNYKNILDEFGKDKHTNFTYFFTTVSLILLNLRTSDHVELAMVSTGFDAMLKDINYDRFLAGITKIIGSGG